jgi:predicted dehydrogenase
VRWKEWEKESIVYVTVQLEDEAIAHFHLNWLSPVKIRRALIGGSRKMVVYDHLDADQQLKIFDKGIDLLESDEDRYRQLVQYRTGDMVVPKVDSTEPLELATQHFVDCILTGQKPLTDGLAGLRVVELLEAAEEAMYSEKKTERARPWTPSDVAIPISA